MRKILLAILLLCGAASATVGINQCTSAGTHTVNCAFSVSAHHVVTTAIFSSGDSDTHVYSDTLGNSFSQPPLPGCNAIAANCNPNVAFSTSASITFAAQSFTLFYISTGSSSGSVTFTVTTGATRSVRILVNEYNEDFVGFDSFKGYGNGPQTLVTAGPTDLIVSMSADSGVVTCSAFAQAPGFTAEFTQGPSCYSYSDKDGVTPGSQTVGPTLSGSAVASISTMAFGVSSTPTTTGIHHRILE
ncbi:MAG: hypothetical protein ACRDQZ_03120 [Mycobacteriales bacterium]